MERKINEAFLQPFCLFVPLFAFVVVVAFFVFVVIFALFCFVLFGFLSFLVVGLLYNLWNSVGN